MKPLRHLGPACHPLFAGEDLRCDLDGGYSYGMVDEIVYSEVFFGLGDRRMEPESDQDADCEFGSIHSSSWVD